MLRPSLEFRQCIGDTIIMIDAHIEALDLNLLRHLDALLGERHVTRAAARVRLTQSAMSRSLAKLRAHLDDALLVRGSGGLVLTPRAEALRAPLRRALEDLGALLGAAPAFDPAIAARSFTMTMADYGQAMLLPPLLARIRASAPGIEIVAISTPADVSGALDGGEVDLAFTPRRAGGAATVWRKLFHDEFVCIARRGHPGVGPRLTLARFLALAHVSITPGNRPGTPPDEALARQGRRRHVVVRVPTFLMAPILVASSDLIGLYPARLANRAATMLPLSVHPTPFPLAGFDLHMGWHERYRHDPAHLWLRQQVITLAADLAA
jgi:DNA-binding transcriptional LysR family regulator